MIDKPSGARFGVDFGNCTVDGCGSSGFRCFRCVYLGNPGDGGRSRIEQFRPNFFRPLDLLFGAG